jgi:phosphoadenosine phosphosulfate reductase
VTLEDIKQAAATLETESAQEIVTWAAGQFPGRLTFASSLGIEDCVVLDMISRQSRPVHVFTLDTELLFPETYELWRQLESKYRIAIEAVRPQQTVAQQAASEGAELWLREPDRCCDLRKMQPLRATLAKYDAWITGIRRDQTPERANAPVVGWDGRFGLIKVNPLVRWTSDDVRRYVAEHEVPYNPLHDYDYPSIGCVPCTSPVRAGEDPRSGRWRGSEKTECGLHMITSKPAAS